MLALHLTSGSASENMAKQKTMNVHYKDLVAVLAGILVSGCGADGVWGNAYESLKMAVKGAPELEISRKSVDQTPYAMITATHPTQPLAFQTLVR